MSSMNETIVKEGYVFGEPSWRRLGKKLSNNMKPEEMARVAGVDWKVHGLDSYVKFNGKSIKTGQMSLVRDDTGEVLSNVGENWKIVQNIEAFDFFNEYVVTGGMDMDTAGSLKGGRIVWAVAKVKEFSFEVFGGDEVDLYLLFSNPHQYGMSVDIQFITIRVICSNGVPSLERRSYKLPHVNLFRDKRDTIKRDIKKTLDDVDEVH